MCSTFANSRTDRALNRKLKRYTQVDLNKQASHPLAKWSKYLSLEFGIKTKTKLKLKTQNLEFCVVRLWVRYFPMYKREQFRWCMWEDEGGG
jgi:hypothetical protein